MRKLDMALVVVWEKDESDKRVKCVSGPEWVEAHDAEEIRIRTARELPEVAAERMEIVITFPFERY